MQYITIPELYKIYTQHSNVQTDTRKLQKGDLFFALKGDNFNGNLFANQAFQAGAAFAVVDEKIDTDNQAQILYVPNVLAALQALALYHRQQFTIPFIGITGSNGKTTTKELVYAVLSKKYKAYTTQGNLNNHIGIPLTILSIPLSAEIAIIEMGANHQKEIEGYCKYVLPTHGLITNCGKAHLEGFGGVEGVKKGKGELFDYLKANQGEAFICSDFDYFETMSQGLEKIIWYGLEKGEIQGSILSSEPYLNMQVLNKQHAFFIHSQLVGFYNYSNILSAVAIGSYFNVTPALITEAIENYAPSNSRSQMIDKGDIKIILDAYNANPSSMQLAIENFAALAAPYKIAMLGGMREMGEVEKEEHQKLVDLLVEKNFDKTILVGHEFAQINHSFNQATNSQEAKEWLAKQELPKGTTLLIKGSRGIAMEKVLTAFER
jgi:UDP-N-acetylmuramoyl-tripeptide--D-alanyl-D-alanine ligase